MVYDKGNDDMKNIEENASDGDLPFQSCVIHPSHLSNLFTCLIHSFIHFLSCVQSCYSFIISKKRKQHNNSQNETEQKIMIMTTSATYDEVIGTSDPGKPMMIESGSFSLLALYLEWY